jgi:hypothetical protein
MQLYDTGSNHWAVGHSHVLNVGAQTVGPPDDYTNGVYDKLLDATNPGATPLVTWQPTCTTNWIPGDSLPPCAFGEGYDSHLSWAYNPGDTDTSPVCGTVYNDSSNIGTKGYPLIGAPWQGEEVCISSSPTWANVSPPNPNPAQRQWRFTHTFNTMTSSDFSTQFGISQLSADGRYLAFSSDWDCTLGDTSGNPTSLCGLPWQSNFAYSVGTLINPIGALNGTGAIYDVFKITTVPTGQKSGTSFPGYQTPNDAWAHCTGNVGCQVTDSNGLVYTDQGKGNAKGEVFIVELRP